jgi:hypothetical protein
MYSIKHSRCQQLLLCFKLLRALRLVYADALRPVLLAAYVAHNCLGLACQRLLVRRPPAAAAARAHR